MMRVRRGRIHRIEGLVRFKRNKGSSDPIAIGLRIYLGVLQDKFVSHLGGFATDEIYFPLG